MDSSGPYWLDGTRYPGYDIFRDSISMEINMTNFVDNNHASDAEIECANWSENSRTWTGVGCASPAAYAICSKIKTNSSPFKIWQIMNRPKSPRIEKFQMVRAVRHLLGIVIFDQQ